MRTFKNNPGLYITATLMIIAGLFLFYKDNIIIKGSTRLRGHVVRTYYKKTDVSIGSERYHRPIMVNVEYKDVMYRTPDGEYRTITLRAKDVKNDSSVDVLYNPSFGSSRAKGSKSGYKYLAISCFIFGGFLWFIVLTSKDEDPSVKEKEDEEKYLEFKKKQEEENKKEREKFLSGLKIVEPKKSKTNPNAVKGPKKKKSRKRNNKK